MSRTFDGISYPVGLTNEEARQRLKQYGPNSVLRQQHTHPVLLFLKKFNSPLLLIVMAASVVSFLLGETVNATILVCMTFLSVTLDFINSYKSERALILLLKRVVTTATVVRQGAPVELPFADIVPGDILLLSAGDVVPADACLLSGRDLFINQSALTGESFPAEKHADNCKARAHQNPTPDLPDFIFMGTSVITGLGVAEAVRTGRQTAFGKIADQLQAAELDTDFERNIHRFSLFVMRLVTVMIGIVFLINAFSGRGWLTSFLFALAIAIGVTPELLPVIMSVALSHGSQRMAKKDVIVKNLSAIQNFGSMNILCTDKTGTLTQDHIALVKYIDGFGASSEQVLLHAYLNSFFHTGVQNPLDDAVRDYRSIDITGFTKVDEIPFDYQRKRESVIVASANAHLLITKGAPEEVFKISEHYTQDGHTQSLDDKARSKILQQFHDLSEDGFRVLAVAIKDLGDKPISHAISEEQNMTFLGFVAFLDPPKETALATIQHLEQLGIEIKIITGDNEILTKKICRDMRLPIRGILTNQDIRGLSDAELQRRALTTTIFARITPEQKERIILCLKNAGQVVGYLGDGINDAPALKAADIGMSVNNAVDVAKETADIILLRKDLDVLKDGVLEGRRTFHNTLKYILMGLSSNFGNMFSMMGASAFLPFLPMLPTQILLNNFLYDTSQLTLSTDHVDEEAVQKPVAWNMKFIRTYMLVFGPVSSLFDFLTFGVLYWGFHLTGTAFQTGWFLESIATQVLVIYVIRTKKIPFLQSRPSTALLVNTLLVVSIAWIIPLTPLGAFFGLAPLPMMLLLLMVGMVLLYLLLMEAVKRWFYKRYHQAFTR
ncbi:MAG: magnesium-translocating P-type ATPase [Patescibacteria group bacterium]